MKSFREQRVNKENIGQNSVNAKEALDGLAGMDEGQLTSLLAKEAAKAKANGTLNADTLRAFWDQMAPMLNEEQRKKLQELMKMIG